MNVSRTYKVKCIDPTNTLTKNKIYPAQLLRQEGDGFGSYFVEVSTLKAADFVNVINNEGKAVRVVTKRFTTA